MGAENVTNPDSTVRTRYYFLHWDRADPDADDYQTFKTGICSLGREFVWGVGHI